jgi:methyl-accepting chemotaxis protein
MLDSFSFRSKIALQLVAAMVAILVISAMSVWQVRQQTVAGREAELVAAVDSAYTIVEGFRSEAAAGRMSQADAQAAARAAVRLSRFGEDGKEYFYIWTTSGEGVMHPVRPQWEGQNMVGKIKDGQGTDVIGFLLGELAKSPNGRTFAMTNFPRPGSDVPVPKLQYVVRVDGWNWMVGSGLYTDDYAQLVFKATAASLLVGVLALMAIGGLGWLTFRSVTRQIGGDPAQAVVAMREVASGNLAVGLGKVVPGSLLAALGEMIQSLRQTVSEVRTATDSISTASSEIASGNQDLSSRTEQTASSLQETAASMEQLTGTVRQSADAARTAAQLAQDAAGVARQGGSVVEQVVSSMGKIHQSSQKISDIIGTIDGIAFQTNILALNAAVEAARAGEQGRGFAVVAGEVRSLAQRSAEAAKEIKALIGNSVDEVENGTRLVADAGQTMGEIVGSVQRVSDIIAEISAATGEQSQGIGQVGVAVTQLDQMTQQNAALVEEGAAAAASLRDQAGRLAGVVATFRLA